MKKTQIKELVHDFLEFSNYQSPLLIRIPNEFKMNLITGEIKYNGEKESVYEFYKEKRDWFKKRVKKLKGNLKDLDYAKVSAFEKQEKIEISYKKEKASGTLKIIQEDTGVYKTEVKLSWKEK